MKLRSSSIVPPTSKSPGPPAQSPGMLLFARWGSWGDAVPNGTEKLMLADLLQSTNVGGLPCLKHAAFMLIATGHHSRNYSRGDMCSEMHCPRVASSFPRYS